MYEARRPQYLLDWYTAASRRDQAALG